MPRNKRKSLVFLLVVFFVVFLIFLSEGTRICQAVEVLDSFTENFQTIGARCQQVPTYVSPDCTYIVPIRYNFGDSNTARMARLLCGVDSQQP